MNRRGFLAGGAAVAVAPLVAEIPAVHAPEAIPAIGLTTELADAPVGPVGFGFASEDQFRRVIAAINAITADLKEKGLIVDRTA